MFKYKTIGIKEKGGINLRETKKGIESCSAERGEELRNDISNENKINNLKTNLARNSDLYFRWVDFDKCINIAM